jgi:hypothetical protein
MTVLATVWGVTGLGILVDDDDSNGEAGENKAGGCILLICAC